jgi:hydroxymethylpyrimidine pyrophosphatase-like HAD family hydrolase
MGNASDPVKAEAQVVAESNTDEGFAKAMERLVMALGT